MRIGLFGGTFDPPHAAHRAACLLALRRLGLDRVWWLVTPGNPLKDTRGLAPLARAGRRRAGAGAPSAHRCHRSRGRARHHLHLRDRFISGAALPRACISSGSWARIICAASIAGSAGAASPNWCRLPWSTGSVQAFTHRRARPARRWRCSAFRKPRQRACRTQAAGLDLPARSQIAAVVDGVARAACVTVAARMTLA